MCGLTGFSGEFDPELLQRMNARIAHRGPDDEGYFVDSATGTGLAHRRLSIIDLSEKGHQPMADPEGHLQLVFNGEIYNFWELRRELEQKGFTFRSKTDTEVILLGYLAYGEAILEKLNGMFAFALFDRRNGNLFVARDHLGIKPLYYAETPKGVVFSSELKALTLVPDLDRTINDHAVRTCVTFLWVPSPHTFVKGIKKLKPGHAMHIKDGRIRRINRYYALPFGQPKLNLSQDELIAQFSTHFQTAIARQMVADVPVGAFLSGGLDSSAIVAMVRKNFPDRELPCFTIAFKKSATSIDGMTYDLPYAQRVAKHLGVNLHQVEVGKELLDHLEAMIWHMDEPQADLGALNLYFISKLAREQGVKVLLSGSGSDDILGGYRRHKALMWEKYWAWLPTPARASLQAATGLLPTNHPRLRRVKRAFSFASHPATRRLINYFYWLPEAQVHQLFAQRPQDPSFIGQDLEEALAESSPGSTDLDRMLQLDTQFFLGDHNLNYGDKLSMATGLEARVPFLDLDLVAFAGRLPNWGRVKGTSGKWVLRKVMEAYLPREIIYRPKAGFGVPLRSWLHHFFRDYVDDVLTEKKLDERGVFNGKQVRALIEADRKGQVDAAYPILAILCSEVWFRLFLDGSATPYLPSAAASCPHLVHP